MIALQRGKAVEPKLLKVFAKFIDPSLIKRAGRKAMGNLVEDLEYNLGFKKILRNLKDS